MPLAVKLVGPVEQVLNLTSSTNLIFLIFKPVHTLTQKWFQSIFSHLHYSHTDVLSDGVSLMREITRLFRPRPLVWFCQHRGQAIKLLVGGRLSQCPWHKHNKQTPTAGLRKQDVLWDVCCLLGNSYQHSEGIRGDPPLFSHSHVQYRLTSTTPTAD